MTSIFGQGLAFPPHVGSDGRFVWSQGEANIRDAIAVILKTEAGERIALPDFGAGLGRFLFEPNNPSTHARIQDAVTTALQRWEPRIQVEAVDVGPDPSAVETALASITYRLVTTGGRERITIAISTGSG